MKVNASNKNKALIEFLNELNEDVKKNIDSKGNKKLFIDYGGANIAKTLHVGHLRPADIGEALKRLAKAVGNEVISDVHFGDIGRQSGMVISETGETLTVTHNMPNTPFATASNNQMRVRYYINDSLTDEVTLTKLRDGIDGNDAYTVTLTNESHTVVCENNGTPSNGELAKAFTDIIVYKGTKAVTNFTVKEGTGADAPTGCTISIDSSTKRVTVASLSADSAKATLIITVDGKEFKKIFSITKSKKAVNGQSAKVLTISGPMAFSYASGASTPKETSIVLTATAKNFSPTDAQIVWKNAKTGTQLGTGKQLTVQHNNNGFVNNVLEVKAEYSADTTVFDTHTVMKVYDGKHTVSGYIWGPQGNIIKNKEMESTVYLCFFCCFRKTLF